MPTELVAGEPRPGNLVDFDPDTPELSVTLEKTDNGIRITVPWSNPASPYARWFSEDQFAGTAGAGIRPVPTLLNFSDSHGQMLLVGCRAQGYRMSFGGPGVGYLWARYAVLGVDRDIDFKSVNGMRVEVTSLRSWLGVSSFREDHTYPKRGCPTPSR